MEAQSHNVLIPHILYPVLKRLQIAFLDVNPDFFVRTASRNLAPIAQQASPTHRVTRIAIASRDILAPSQARAVPHVLHVQ